MNYVLIKSHGIFVTSHGILLILPDLTYYFRSLSLSLSLFFFFLFCLDLPVHANTVLLIWSDHAPFYQQTNTKRLMEYLELKILTKYA